MCEIMQLEEKIKKSDLVTVLQGIFSLYSSGKFVTLLIYLIYTEAVSWRCSVKKVFL